MQLHEAKDMCYGWVFIASIKPPEMALVSRVSLATHCSTVMPAVPWFPDLVIDLGLGTKHYDYGPNVGVPPRVRYSATDTPRL